MKYYRNDNKWSVYIHIVPKQLSNNENDKFYVGITSQTPKKRWGSGYGYINNIYFYRAIKKYGWNNIIHDVVSTHLTLNEACDMEQALIKILKSNINTFGYNLTNGGDTRLHRSYKGENNPQSKPIYQFDKDFKFIKKYPSSIEADMETHAKSSEAAREKYISGGFYWAREDNIFMDENKKIHMINNPILVVRKEIFQFDTNFNFIERYSSTRNVELKTNYYHTTINRASKCRNIVHGFYWLCKNDVDVSDVKPKIKCHIIEELIDDPKHVKRKKENGCLKIVNVTKNELFTSIQNATKHYNIDPSYLRKVATLSIYNKNRTAKKCKWLLYNDYLLLNNITDEDAKKHLLLII